MLFIKLIGMVFPYFTDAFLSPYNVWGRFRHTDTRCFCAYQTYRLENSFSEEAAQSGIVIMQFDVKLSKSTSDVCGFAQNLPFRDN